MLSQSDIDQLEGYLCKATLNDLPNVLMKVLPLVFAELRTMQRALDTQAENFFDGLLPRDDGRGRVAVEPTGVAGTGVHGGSQPDAAVPVPRTEVRVHPATPVSEEREVAPDPRGLRGEDQVRPVPVVGAGVGPALGGEVRPEAGHGHPSGSQPDAPVKKRRGRPRKQSVDGVLGIEPITHGGE